MTVNREPGCEALDARIIDYLAQTLPAREREEFEAHLAGCGPCRLHFSKVREAAYLSCQELVELVTDYLEGRLAATDRERFEGHLALCPGCDAYLAQMRQTIRLTGQLTEQSVSAEAKRQLLTAFRNWKRA